MLPEEMFSNKINKKQKKIIIGIAIFLLLSRSKMVNAEKIIKFFEAGDGVKKYLNAYQDLGGVWTIGYGSTFNYAENRPVKKGDVITEQIAIDWLRKEMKDKIIQIKQLVKVPINQNQLDALTSFSYNLGIGALKSSTLLKLLNSGADKYTVSNQFLRWNKALIDGQYIEVLGLTRRREAERVLFLK